MQMLWARCISDSVRAVDPTCCQGVYTPEEVEDFVDVKPLSISGDDVKARVSARAQQTEPVKTKPAEVKKEDYLEAEVIEPEQKPEPKTEPKAKATVKAKTKATPEPKPEPEPKEVTNEIEPTPFDEPEEEIDFTLCPIFGQLQGKPWSGMTKSNLEYAKKKYASELKPQHIAVIDAEIAKK